MQTPDTKSLKIERADCARGVTTLATLGSTPYQYSVLDLPADAAAAALDRCLEDWALRRGDGRSGIQLGRAQLLLDDWPTPVERRPRSASWPVRRIVGTLRSKRGWHRVKVEVELLPWSSDRAELGLRPLRWPLRFLARRQYLRYGGMALDHIAAEIREWAAIRSELGEDRRLRDAS